MNRRWQKDGAKQWASLPSIGWMLEQLPPLPLRPVDLGLADASDLYSVLSALHAKGRNPRPAACPELGFCFFEADVPALASDLHATPAQVRAAPHSW